MSPIKRSASAFAVDQHPQATGSSPPDRTKTARSLVIFEQMEQVLRERLQALPPAARAELLHVLMLPDFERADLSHE